MLTYYEDYTFLEDYDATPGQYWPEIAYEIYGDPKMALILQLVNQDLFSLTERESLTIDKTVTLKTPDITIYKETKSELPEWRI